MAGGFQQCPVDQLLETLKMNEGNQEIYKRLLEQEGVTV